jgi:3-oxoacyl-(acyl-carrier-protein) synthase
MAEETDVVITGMGCVSPHGRGVAALWDGLLAGRSALVPLTLFDASAFRNPLAGVVDGYPAAVLSPLVQGGDREGVFRSLPADAVSADVSQMPRAFRMLEDAAAEAMRDAYGLDASAPQEELDAKLSRDDAASYGAIVTGSNFGGMSAAETALTEGRTDHTRAGLSGYLFGTAGERLARRYQMRGPRMNVSLACASGTAAIGIGLDIIRQGRAEMVLACGYDELSLYVYAFTPASQRCARSRQKPSAPSTSAAKARFSPKAPAWSCWKARAMPRNAKPEFTHASWAGR